MFKCGIAVTKIEVQIYFSKNLGKIILKLGLAIYQDSKDIGKNKPQEP